jgi:hypothetical protein
MNGLSARAPSSASAPTRVVCRPADADPDAARMDGPANRTALRSACMSYGRSQRKHVEHRGPPGGAVCGDGQGRGEHAASKGAQSPAIDAHGVRSAAVASGSSAEAALHAARSSRKLVRRRRLTHPIDLRASAVAVPASGPQALALEIQARGEAPRHVMALPERCVVWCATLGCVQCR